MTGEMGLGLNVYGSNPKLPMSALCQKRTSELVQSISAIPLKADIAKRHRHVRFAPEAGNHGPLLAPLQEAIYAGTVT